MELNAALAATVCEHLYDDVGYKGVHTNQDPLVLKIKANAEMQKTAVQQQHCPLLAGCKKQKLSMWFIPLFVHT